MVEKLNFLTHFIFSIRSQCSLAAGQEDKKMETTSVSTQSSTFDRQQVSKNKRKKFNPRCMLTNNSSDDDETGHGAKTDQDQIDEENQSSSDEQQSNENEVIKKISNSTFSITKDQRSDSSSHLFMAPSKQMFLQSYNLQQQQQMFQQAAMNVITPQFSQQLESATDLNETKAMFREFAFKTMQDLLNIYGLPLPTNEIIDAMSEYQYFKRVIKRIFWGFLTMFGTQNCDRDRSGNIRSLSNENIRNFF